MSKETPTNKSSIHTRQEVLRQGLSRRSLLGVSAGVAAAAALPSLAPGAAHAVVDGSWTPKFFSTDQGQTLATLCDLILPKTDTPSATEAGVHEYIDEALSVADGEEQLEFLGGLAWIEHRANQQYRGAFGKLTEKQQIELLEEVSDESEPGPELKAGATFFADLKQRALFGYYTSKPGRVALGLPESVRREKLQGCTHGPDGHG